MESEDLGRPIRLILEDYPEGEDYYGPGRFHASGQCYVDPETGESIIRVIKPPEGTDAQKVEEAAKVLRHEIGHSRLHLRRYGEEASLKREKDPEAWLRDEIEVAVWEYSLEGKASPLRRRLSSLAEVYRKRQGVPSRVEAYRHVSNLTREASLEILGYPIQPVYSGSYTKGFLPLGSEDL